MALAFTPALKFLFRRFVKLPDLARVVGISLPSLSKYKRLGSIPTKINFNKLTNLYNRVQYRSLRYAGASTGQANRFKGKSSSIINKIIANYNQTANRISKRTGFDEDFITSQIAKSSKRAEKIFESN